MSATGLPVFNVRTFGAVGDGVTNDSSSIAAADAASAPGQGILYFPAETYLCNSLSLASPIIWGANATLRLGPSGSVILNGGLSNYVEIRGLIFDCNGVASSIGVFLNSGLTGARIHDCRFVNGVYGIQSNNSNITDLRVMHNDFQTDAGILLNNGTLDTIAVADNRFKGTANVGTGCNINTPSGSSSKIMVANNIFDGYSNNAGNTSGFGIDLAGSTSSASLTLTDVTVSGNTIVNCAGDSIHVEGSCRGITISGNTIDNGSGNGIQITNTGTLAPSVLTVVGNTVTSCGSVFGSAGIAFTGTGSGVLGEVLINGNTVRGCGRAGASSFDGIQVFGSGKIVISNNIVVNTIGTTSAGIGCSGNVTVGGNRCFDDGAGTQHYGCNPQGTGAIVNLFANDFTGNTTADILWSSTAAASGRSILSGTGSPNNVHAATVGALYQQTDGGAGTVLWAKTSGSAKSGWTTV